MHLILQLSPVLLITNIVSEYESDSNRLSKNYVNNNGNSNRFKLNILLIYQRYTTLAIIVRCAKYFANL